MGQSSSKLRKKHSNSSTRSQELNVEAEEFVNRSKIEKELTRSLCDYNRALMEEQRGMSGPITPEYLQDLRLIRLTLEEQISLLEGRLGLKVRNTFTSFSPWKYSLKLPVLETSVEKKRRSNSITSIKRHDIRQDPDSPVFTCTFIEAIHTSHQSVFKLLFATAADVSSKVEMASQFGRIVGCNISELQFENLDPARLASHLLIRHTCDVFAGHIVSGIPFLEVQLTTIASGRFSTPFKSLNDWLLFSCSLSFSDMVREFNRLIKVGFKVSRMSPLVYLFTNADPESASEIVQVLRDLSRSNKPPLAIISGKHLDQISVPLVSGLEIGRNQVSIEKHIDTT
jgi:hypothetical protein